MSADAMIKTAHSQLGYHERRNGTTKYGKWFARRHGAAYRAGDWCAMGLLWCANTSGNLNAVGGDHAEWAYVPTWWDHFKHTGRTGGTPHRGAIVFFDFNRTGSPEHVGICIGTRAGLVETIEFNTEDACRRRDRRHADVLGYAYPAYQPDHDRVEDDERAMVVSLGA